MKASAVSVVMYRTIQLSSWACRERCEEFRKCVRAGAWVVTQAPPTRDPSCCLLDDERKSRFDRNADNESAAGAKQLVEVVEHRIDVDYVF